MRPLPFAYAFVMLTLVLAGAAIPSAAQSPESYPFCALDASSGATSCYYESRAQCGSRCIPNPSYVGPRGAIGGPGVWYRMPRR